MSGDSRVSLPEMFDWASPADVGSVRWTFKNKDSNESARRMFAQTDRLMRELNIPDHVFLSTIELDVDPGRFPEVLAAYFQHATWGYDKRFFIGQIEKVNPGDSYAVGRLTFEAEVGQLVEVLGFRWGANLRVGGVQVPNSAVPQALRSNLFEAQVWSELEGIVRLAWVASKDLDKLAVWASADDIQATLSTLTPNGSLLYPTQGESRSALGSHPGPFMRRSESRLGWPTRHDATKRKNGLVRWASTRGTSTS